MTTTLDKLDTINDSLNDIKTAIIGKGQTPSGNITTYATAIDNIVQSSPVIDSLSITPTTSAQTITAPSGTDGYSPITVSAVTAAIDSNITASNIKSGVSILGVTGTVTELNGETRTATLTSSAGNTFTPSSGKNAITSITVTPNNQARSVTPSTLAQTLSVNSGYSGNGTISVSAVTSSIDANITAENIKKDVTILGVTGSLESGGGTESTGLKANYVLLSSNGTTYDIKKLTKDSSNILDPKGTVISTGLLSGAYRENLNVREVNLSALEEISHSYALMNTFYGCTNLIKVDVSALKTVSGALGSTFSKTGLTTIDFSSLTSVTGTSAFYWTLDGCTALTDVYFRALTTTSFGSNVGQFTTMLTNTGTSVVHTIHFPSNLQSIISGLTGYPTFGGESGYVVLAFDLPATS